MNRRSRVTAAVPAALLLLLATSCSDPTDVTLTELNLERPVDIAFACYGLMNVHSSGDPLDGMVTTTAQPTYSCDTRSPQLSSTITSPPAGQENLASLPTWYGFILQSASGTVVVSKWNVQSSQTFLGSIGSEVSVLDGDHLTPGRNAISVGEDPVAIATDKSGCYEVVANAGSCDISVLDVNTAVAAAEGNPTSKIRVDRLAVTDSKGTPMKSKPAAMVGQPGATDVGATCSRTGTDGLSPQGIAYVAYPSCHLVAALDASDGVSGKLVAGIHFGDDGTPAILTGDALDAVVDACPDECSGAIDPSIAAPRPVALDLKLENRPELIAAGVAPTERLAIGANNSSKLTIVELDVTTSLPTAVSQIPLEDKTPTKNLGLTSVSISARIAMGNGVDDTQGAGGPSQFVYAVANDKSVRVASLALPDRPDPATECDTEVDMRFVRNLPHSPSLFKCFAVGGPDTPPRRSGAHSPGIELIEDSIPTSVTIFRGLPAVPANTTVTVYTMVGYFAAISTTSGRVFIVNVDDDNSPDFAETGISPFVFDSPVLHIPHQLRDGFGDRSAAAETCAAVDPLGNTLNGGPRTTTVPLRTLPTNTVQSGAVVEMPSLLQLTCTDEDSTGAVTATSMVSQLELAAGVADQPTGTPNGQNVLDNTYPDLRNILTETWTMTWEGPLSGESNSSQIVTADGPQIRTGEITVDGGGMKLSDPAHAFCEIGVEPFDIVQFHGCNPNNGDADCPSGYSCYVHPRSKVSGIGNCMATDEADRLATACFDFLATDRRYTVASAGPDQVVLLPRKHELYATPVAGCTDDLQCDTIAQYTANNNLAADPYVAPDATDPKKPHTEWSCRIDDQRKPLNDDPTAKRCVQTCAFHSNSDVLKAAGDPSYDGLDRDADCTAGTICVGAAFSATADSASRGVCMESVQPPQSCVNGPQQFDVRASDAFTVIGTTSGYIHPIVAKNNACVRGPDATTPMATSRLEIGRIPLTAPACAADANPITGELASQPGMFEPNPCSLTVQQTDVQNNYLAGSCDIDTTTTSIITRRDNAPAIKFSNRAMTVDLVDPTYPGDKTCIQDRQGPFSGVSFVTPGASPTALGYQLSFSQTSGFDPLSVSLPVAAAFPVKLVHGPSESIWLLDDGDSLSVTLGVPSTAGQVYRIESTNINIINLLQ